MPCRGMVKLSPFQMGIDLGHPLKADTLDPGLSKRRAGFGEEGGRTLVKLPF